MKHNSPERHEVSREPWWKYPPKEGQADGDLEWGYLIIFDDQSVEFDDTKTPSDGEIEKRTGSRTAGHGL